MADEKMEQYAETAETFAKAIEKAKSEGFEVIQGDLWHLLLDFDSPGPLVRLTDAPAAYYVGLQILNENGFLCHEENRWPSKDGGLHVVVKLDVEIDLLARLGLQAMLGSDAKRELLSFTLNLKGVSEPSLLFKPKGENDAVAIPF